MVGTLSSVWIGGNTEMFEKVGTLRCLGKDGNTEVCREGYEH